MFWKKSRHDEGLLISETRLQRLEVAIDSLLKKHSQIERGLTEIGEALVDVADSQVSRQEHGVSDSATTIFSEVLSQLAAQRARELEEVSKLAGKLELALRRAQMRNVLSLKDFQMNSAGG